MAKTSRTVTKTSGQGVSRFGYQTGYGLGNRGTASPGGRDVPHIKGEALASLKSGRGGKPDKDMFDRRGKGAIDKAGGMNVSYGDTIFPTDLKDVESVGERKPPKSPGFLKLGKKHSYKDDKNNSGFLKGKK